VLKSEDVAIYIDAKHMCVSSRGIKDTSSSTVTSAYSGKFEEDSTKKEFLATIQTALEM
jgi:GTP cyclohydrolase I